MIMNNQLRKKIKEPKILFVVLMLAGYIMYWLSVALDDSNNIVYYFCSDPNNTFMDFFNPIAKEPALTYVKPHYSNYPALGNLFFAMVKTLLPESLNSSPFAMRETIMPMLYLIIFLISCILAIEKLITRFLAKEKKDHRINSFVTYVILLSGPFLFCYERGNNLLLSLIFIMIFVFYYEDKNPVLKEISLICLAIAAAIKIYPAIFGILLVKRGNVKTVVHSILYGILFMFIPFWLGYDGMESVINFLQNIVSRNGGRITFGLGYNFSFSTLMKICLAFGGNNIPDLPKPVVLIPIFLTIILYVTSKEPWKKTFAICLFITWVPNASYTYVLCYFVMPLLIYLKTSGDLTKKDIVYVFGFVLMFSLYSLQRVKGLGELDINYQLSWGMVIIHVDMLVITLFMLIDNTKRILEDKKYAV